MSKIIKSIETNFVSFLNDYSKILIDKFNLNEVEVQKITDAYVFNNMNIVLSSSSNTNDDKKPLSKNNNSTKCSHVFTKGTKIGEICSLNAKEGSTLCTRHMKLISSSEKKEDEKKPTNTLKKIVLGLNKDINRYWHKESKLVFHSKEKLVVIGRVRDDNKFYEELRDDDIDECKKYHFKFEKIEALSNKQNIDELKKKNIEDAIDELLLKNGITSSTSSSENEDNDEEDLLNEEE
jgi:hypothetical protein